MCSSNVIQFGLLKRTSSAFFDNLNKSIILKNGCLSINDSIVNIFTEQWAEFKKINENQVRDIDLRINFVQHYHLFYFLIHDF